VVGPDNGGRSKDWVRAGLLPDPGRTMIDFKKYAKDKVNLKIAKFTFFYKIDKKK
jgi:hypothetical protein